MLVFFIADDYEIRPNSWCTQFPDQTFPTTLAGAKYKCNAYPSCTMFYHATGKGTQFRLCDDSATIKASASGSILYIKRSEYTSICMLICRSTI